MMKIREHTLDDNTSLYIDKPVNQHGFHFSSSLIQEFSYVLARTSYTALIKDETAQEQRQERAPAIVRCCEKLQIEKERGVWKRVSGIDR